MAFKILIKQCAILVTFSTIFCYAQINLDPCYSKPCLSMATCISTNNTYFTCECPDGFSGDGIHNCTNVCNPNPCPEDNFSCHTISTSSPRATPYVCTCDSPYNMSKNGQCCNSWCPPVNTSQHTKNKFLNLVKVQNTGPICHSHCSFLTFTCAENFINYQNPPKCIAYNVCEPMNPCVYGKCSADPSIDSFACDCYDGYRQDENGVCNVDIDECAEQTACTDAINGTVCTNTNGGYTCSCDSNYTIAAMQDDNTFACIPRDVCNVNNGECEQNCENSPEGPRCSCVEGYISHGPTCRFDDSSSYVKCNKSCSSNEDIQAGICLNHTCQCFSGYKLKNGICIPEYSCADINHSCNFNFKCVNTSTRPGYTCNCNDTMFMTGSDGKCYDVDECVSGDHECEENATCVNMDYGYTCQCNPGFIGKGPLCTELPNVCLQPRTLASCNSKGLACRQQSPGVSDCYCAIPSMLIGNGNYGYTCAPPETLIYIYKLSMELIGLNYGNDSFDTRRQLESDLSSNLFPNILSSPVLNLEVVKYQLLSSSNAVISVNLLFGENVSYLSTLMKEICSPYSFIDNSCILPSNFITINDTISIVDITNSTICNNPDLLCGENAKCNVKNHDFWCQCQPSYVAAGYVNSRKTICSDMNECLNNPSICDSPTQLCVNNVGNYTCECLPCYIWDDKHDDCIFICQENPCQNNGFCETIITQDSCGYGCTCSQDYFGPNCEYENSSLHVAKNNEAIIGGVLGGLLLIMFGISIFLVYKMFRWKGYFSIQKRKPGNV